MKALMVALMLMMGMSLAQAEPMGKKLHRDLLTEYVSIKDKATADIILDAWIDGFLTGQSISLYMADVHDFDDGTVNALYDCVRSFTADDWRTSLLTMTGLGKDWNVSVAMYGLVELNCADQLNARKDTPKVRT